MTGRDVLTDDDKELLGRGILTSLIAVLSSVRHRSTPRDEAFCPIAQSIRELENKLEARPAQLWRSAKLYRAIDNIEGSALKMRLPRRSRHLLQKVVFELRAVSGWTAAE
jgi:hypothetical protein